MSAIDRISIIPYARKREIEFFGTNLRPDRTAKFYFDEINVDEYVQSASELIITGTDATKYNVGEKIICETTNSFSTVIRSVSPNKLFLNDNFITLNVAQYGATSLTSSTFAVGDIIFQGDNNSTTFTSNTFSARVEHWFSSNNALVVTPLSGTANNSSTKRVLHSVINSNRANLSSINVQNKFPTGSIIKSAATATKTSTVGSYSHNNGVVSVVNPTTTKINLSSTYTGTTPTTIKIVDGSGYTQDATISSLESSNTVAVLSTAITGLNSTSRYSIGSHVVDSNTNIAGIFYLPENENLKFYTGERIFTITDATTFNGSDSTMKATAKYSTTALSVQYEGEVLRVTRTTEATTGGSGAVTTQPGSNTVDTSISTEVEDQRTTNEETQTGSPTTTVTNPFNFVIPDFILNMGSLGIPFGDPVAQTFITPRKNYGMFATSVDLFFKSKPTADDAEIPVTVRIVSTLNGYPTNRVIASATVQCYDVKTTDGISTFPRSSNTSTLTKFTFSDPVFLLPSTEYAIVVYSDSPAYEVWVSELGSSIIGDADGRRVSEQPYVGSFFKSQNASTWTPYQNEDLMFRINRAVFDTSPINLTFGPVKQSAAVPYDEIILNASEFEFPVANIDHAIKTTLISTSALESTFSDISPNKPFWFAEKPDSLVTSGRRRVIPASNTTAFQSQVTVDTNDNYVSPFFNAENYNILVSQNIINNGELYNTSVTVTNDGFHSNASNVVVTISDSNLYPGETGARATANVTLNASGNVTSVNIINAGKGYVESPTITIAEPGRAANATAVITSEDSKFGGNALARYITRKVTLADGFDSGDLRVTLKAIRPQGTHIAVYYKVQSDSDSRNFSDIKWRRMYLENDVISPDLNTAIDFKYNPSSDPRINKISYIEDGVTYPIGGTFKYFAIKIVMLAECGCVAPTIRNLRAISLPEG